VQTFWELLDKIDGGDGSHFSDDQEVIKVASGATRKPLMLPNPLSFAVEFVLKLPRPTTPLSPQVFRQMYTTVMKAHTRDELYHGVPVITGLPYLRGFDPRIVRDQQEAGEQAHVKRFKWAKRTKVASLSPDAWARAMIKNNVGISLSHQQAALLGSSLDAAYRFDMQVWKVATEPQSSYNPEKHRNDWTDLQQTLYLCDPSIHLMTADRPLCKKVSTSNQANRVHYLPDYLTQNGLSV